MNLSGYCRAFLCFGDREPDLRRRSMRDNADYEGMRPDLWTHHGRVTDPALFLQEVTERLDGCWIAGARADPYKKSELLDAWERAGRPFPLEVSKNVPKRHMLDCRALQRLVATRRIAMKESLAFLTAVAQHVCHRDVAGNPLIDKRSQGSRIDVLSAALLAAGQAIEHFDRPFQPGLFEPYYD